MNFFFNHGFFDEPRRTIRDYLIANSINTNNLDDVLAELEKNAQDLFYHINRTFQNFPFFEVETIDNDYKVGLYSDHVPGFRV